MLRTPSYINNAATLAQFRTNCKPYRTYGAYVSAYYRQKPHCCVAARFAAILAIVACRRHVGRVLRPPMRSRVLFTPAMRLFGGDPSVALRVYRLQIARMVDLGGCPAPAARLGLADDVMHLVGRCES